MTTSAQVTLSISDYQSLQTKIADLEKKIAEMEIQAEALKLGGGDEQTGRALIATVRQASEVIRFCVANLDPAIVRGWPHEALRTFAEGLAAMPTATIYEKEMASEMQGFAHEASGYEAARRPIRGTPPGPPATAADRELSPAARKIHEIATGIKSEIPPEKIS